MQHMIAIFQTFFSPHFLDLSHFYLRNYFAVARELLRNGCWQSLSFGSLDLCKECVI